MIPVLCGDDTPAWVDALNQQAPSPQYTDQLVSDARVAVFTAPCAAKLSQLAKLEWAHCTYAGVEAALSATDLPIARLIDPRLTDRMAQSALFAALNHCQHSPSYRRYQDTKTWKPIEQIAPAACQVLILGAGELACACARRLKQSGFRVATYSRRAKVLSWPHFCHLSPEVIGGADLVINLLPMTQQTKHIVDQAFLDAMKASAGFVNFGRSGSVDTPALMSALDAASIEYALLDVFDEEPLPADSALWDHPRVILWPHVSAQTEMNSAAMTIHANIQSFLDSGALPASMVNRKRGY